MGVGNKSEALRTASVTGDEKTFGSREEVGGEWIQAARGGDPAALSRIYQQFQGAIHSAARKYANSSIPRDDLLQEGALAVLLAIRDFEPLHGVPFAAFAMRRIYHAVWGAVRQRKRCLSREEAPPGDEEGDALTQMADPASEARVRQMEDALWLDVWMNEAKLSAREKLLVRSVVFESTSVVELAAQFSLSPDTAYTWKRRAAKKLRAARTSSTNFLH